MHVLITGASGFIGRVLFDRLRAKGHRVKGLIRPGNRVFGNDCIEYSLGSAAPLELPPGIDAVIHLAQARAYQAFPGDAAEMFQVNVAGTQTVLEAAAAAGIKHVCLASSGAVYAPFKGILTEDAPLAPRSYLGASKLAAEIIALPFETQFSLSILRLFTPYGPGQSNRLIPDLIWRIRSGEPVDLPESSDGMRFAPTYVDDVCDVIESAVMDDWTGVFNVAMPGSITIGEAVAIIGKILGKDVITRRKPLSAPVVVPDLTRLAGRYDLDRFRRFEDGISATVLPKRGR